MLHIATNRKENGANIILHIMYIISPCMEIKK